MGPRQFWAATGVPARRGLAENADRLAETDARLAEMDTLVASLSEELDLAVKGSHKKDQAKEDQRAEQEEGTYGPGPSLGAHEIDQTFGAGAADALQGETGGRFGAKRQSVVAKTQKLLIEFRDSDVES